MTLRGSVETYALTPSDEGAFGSVTITNGIQITAHAYYNHLISEFHSCDDDPLNFDKYVFSYQIKISVDPTLTEEQSFYKSQLKTRTWIINKEPGDIDGVENQPGVVGYYPTVSRDSLPFIYES